MMFSKVGVGFCFRIKQLILMVGIMMLSINFCFAAVINFESASSAVNANGGAFSLVLPKPSGVVSGDLLFAAVNVTDGYGSLIITPPIGWIFIAKNDNGNVSLATYYKIASASEPANYTWNFNLNRRSVGGILRYSGVDNLDAFENVVDGTDNKVENVNVTAPAAMASSNNSLVLRLFGINRGLANFHNYSAGLTERVDIAHSHLGGGSLGIADFIQSVAGSTGTATAQGNGYTLNRPFVIQNIVFNPQLRVLSAETQDNNFNGKIDNIVVKFSKEVNDSGMYNIDPGMDVNAGIMVSGYDVISVSGNGTDTLTYTLAEGSLSDTGATPVLTWNPSNLKDFNNNDLDLTAAPTNASDGAFPLVESIKRNGVNPTNVQNLDFLVKFTEPVSGVDLSDFDFVSTGSVSGFSMLSLSPVGNDYLITVDRGVDIGTLGLKLIDDDTIEDVVNKKLKGSSDGSFVGESYTISGGTLLNVDVQRALLTAGSVSNVNVLFTTINSIPVDGKIKVNFGSNFDLTGVSSVNCSSMDGMFNFSVIGNQVSIERQGDGTVEAPGDQTCVIAGVKNPSFAGSTGTYSVLTTDGADFLIDEDSAVAADVILPNILNATSVSGSSLIQSEQSNITIAFTTQNGLQNNDKIDVVFPAGFGLGSVSGAVCSTMDGTVNVSVSGQTVTLTRSGGTFQAPAAESCVINGVVNPNVAGLTGMFTITTKTNSGDVRDTKANINGLNIESASIVQQGGGGGGGGGGSSSFGKSACSGQACLLVKDQASKGVQVFEDQNKTEKKSVQSELKQNFFRDVLTSNSSWALEYIEKLKEKCGIEGYKDEAGNLLKEFRPDNNVSRRELVKMVMKCKNKSGVSKAFESPFSDVLLSDWGLDEIVEAKKIGAVSGYPGTNNFRPNDWVRRSEAVKMIILSNFKFEELANVSLSGLARFSDVVATEWYGIYLAFGLQRGFFSGYEGTSLFGPGDNLTRAQAAKIIVNVFGL